MDKETKQKKFTFAEPEENAEDLQKLEGWLKRIKARDLVGGERATEAMNSLEDCRKALLAFADQAYVQN